MLAGTWLWAVAAASLPFAWLPAVPHVSARVPHEHESFWIVMPWLPAGLSPALTTLAADQPHPAVARFLAVDFNLRDALLPVAVLHLALVLFLSGGIFDRLARDRRVGASGFFAACGGHFGRFARMGVVVAPLYVLFFTLLNSWFLIASVVALSVFVDYARVRVVVEDRRSALGALGAGFRFVGRHLPAVLLLAGLNAIVFAGVATLDLLSSAGPPAGFRTARNIGAALLYAAAGLLFAASQIALFQSQLAHAGYTAAPVPKWPDSPAAEAIKALD